MPDAHLEARLTEHGRRALGSAQWVALGHGDPAVDDVHLLLGMLAPHVLGPRQCLDGVDVVGLATELEAAMGPGQAPLPPGLLPFAPVGDRAVGSAVQAANALGHLKIEAAHLLLGVIGARGRAAQALAAVGADGPRLYEVVGSLYRTQRTLRTRRAAPSQPATAVRARTPYGALGPSAEKRNWFRRG